MKKSKKIMAMILMVFMMTSILPMGFSATALELSTTEGKAQGEAFGALEGADAAQRDFNLGRVSNYLLDMPTHAEITKQYNLSKDDAYYRNAFLTGFRAQYEIAYKSTYREMNLKIISEPYLLAEEQGAGLGTIEGQISAMKDYYSGYDNDWERGYRNFIYKGSLYNRYQLENETARYRLKFENAFRDSFRTAYIETYQGANIDLATRNSNLILVDMYQKTISFEDAAISFTGGSMVTEASTPVTLEFPEGTLYEPTYFSMYKIPNSFNMDNYKYRPVSSKFVVSIDNVLRGVTLNAPIELSFEYYGSERAGIYMWKNNQWHYQYTEIEEGTLKTIIPAGYYTGGEYAIFIDDKFNYISDIGFNWAYREIYTLMRRGIVEDSLKFRPNDLITRAEFADMIYKSASPTKPYTGAGTYAYADVAQYGDYKTAIEYVVSKQYMKLDDSGAFNPMATVTYADVEKTMGMLLTRTFNWGEIARKMMYDKYARSEGAMDIQKSIKRSEVAYMIYDVFK
ncbi:S-layer homology domain-containing protein [Fusibacter tunisiensis]|uniref:SLH domain-containing protein n=1 Tax=Fusibacter tunisiensis TaxID=1008308 RepID=A0ABS2MTJ3_9FIRM|nr:S-layer homology domain-containing protein [Fusibacter tunisiensis]MBM7562692.1 hypothetical protein [Fusibacter tunisiensis]